MALARSEGVAQRFYSLSSQIRTERAAYYDILEATQKGGLDVAAWLQWFLTCLDRAFERADGLLSRVLGKARFWERFADARLNDRQREVFNRLLDGFEGKLTSSKWGRLTGCSQDTALRDIEGLLQQGLLTRNAPRRPQHELFPGDRIAARRVP
jgi:Fic family protein